MKTRIVETSKGFVPQVNTGYYETTWWFGSRWVDRWEGIDRDDFTLCFNPAQQLRWATCKTLEEAQGILDKYLKREEDEDKLR